jgi:mRNA interferase YafQ
LPNSKPKQNVKRADPPRDAYKTKQFIKDWDRLLASGRYDLVQAKEAMMLLISGQTLGPEWRDHGLSGEYADYRECHIGGDFLLIYKIDHESRTEKIAFARIGTHSELFN